MPADHGTLRSVDSEAELRLREIIFDRLAEIVAEHGVITRTELESLQVGSETRRIIDRNRGIWNPQDLLATLSVVSNPEGPYADSHVGDSLFAYDYRSGSTDGDNRKMRRAYELGLPIILLQQSELAFSCPFFPYTSWPTIWPTGDSCSPSMRACDSSPIRFT